MNPLPVSEWGGIPILPIPGEDVRDDALAVDLGGRTPI
jgi:hypothetical protein